MNNNFKAVIIEEVEPKKFERRIGEKSFDDLPNGDTIIKVEYSSLNYKDALSSIGNKGVSRYYPHTPGIDAAGTIVSSENNDFVKGEEVFITGYDLGMNTSGGYQEYIRVPSEWIVKKPEGLTLRDSMIIGTAGFTAALSVYKFVNTGVKPEDGEVLVTGATGGVGTIAVSLLSKLGYEVIGATGKLSEKESLIKLGAKDVVDRNELNDESGKPLLKPRWAGVIDTVGGNTLSTAIRSCAYGATVTCCGNVGGHVFDANVYPFILKGVSLLGIDSVMCPMEIRKDIWNKLSDQWKLENLSDAVTEVGFEGLFEKIDSILKGKHKGRTIVKIK